MLRVGLTGGIGAGKSTVATRLVEHGAVLVDADVIAREVVEKGTDGLAEVVEAFGEGVLAADGSLDRAALAARVFGDGEARGRLNGIIHPRVRLRTAELVGSAPADAIVVNDVPLLTENHYGPLYHLVLVVDAPAEDRVRRVVQRGMPEADARARMAAQATDAERRAVADVWLDNAGSPGEVRAAVDALWANRLVPFEANLRLGRFAPRGGPRLADPDPTWPAQAQRLMARVELAAGEAGVRVDHIGSTAIAALAAKDIIDLQLTVVSLDDTEPLTVALAEAGFPVVAGVDGDNPKPVDPDPAHWRKRQHAGADPGRAVNLHVRELGSAGWRYALLFRDWLRAGEAARREYEQHKRELAAKHAADQTTEGYAEAKEPWFDAALPRAEAWAERTGWTP